MRTNLSKSQHPIATVMATYREQSKGEKRFPHRHGPMAETPMFLKNPPRIAGWLIIRAWALTVVSLMERAVRQKLKGKPMDGLNPENRPSPAPTGVRPIEKFASLSIVVRKDSRGTHRRLGPLSPIQREILKLLDLPDKVLPTFKRKCGT